MNIFIPIRGRLYKNRANGINQVIYSHAKYLNRLGANLSIFGLCKSSPKKGETIIHDNFEVNSYPKVDVARLINYIKKCDLVCIHGIFDFYLLLNVSICIALQKKYIIVPHNALDPLFMKKNRLIKFLYMKFFGIICLKKSSFVYCVTQEEETEILSVFNGLKTKVFPNGIDKDDYSYLNELTAPSLKKDRIDAVFIGRISEEKNLENAILAVISYNNSHSERLLVFNIVGPDTYFSEFLKRKYPFKYIKFHGPLYGNEKFDFMRKCDFMLHPSISEVMSISVIEAMYLKVPVCVSRGSKLTHYYNTNSFFITEPTVTGLLRSICEFTSQADRWSMIASNASALVDEKLNWHEIVKDFYLEIDINVSQ